MAETAVEIATCRACGADVRDESVFCYNCGERVAAETPTDTPVDTDPFLTDAVRSDTPVIRSTGDARPPLRSAASLRKQRRASNRQPVEVTWEPTTRSPALFMITTIVLASAALVLLVLALYLR